MTRVLRYLVRKFYILCAIALITLAVVVQCGRSFSHLVSEYREELNLYLSERLNADVHIGAINAHWRGLKPVVEAREIRITSHAREPILALKKARLRLDLLGSLAKLQLVWGSVNLHEVDLEFEQTPDGFWRLPGLSFQYEKPPEEAAQLDVLFDMLLLANHIEFHQSHLSFRFVDGHQITFDSPSVRLENKANFHRLSLQVDIEEQEGAVKIVIEGRGDPRRQKRFRAHGYLQLYDFPTSEPLAAAGALLLPGVDDLAWRSEGSVNARLWFSTRRGGEGFDLTGTLGLQKLSLPVLGRRLDLGSFNTDVNGHWLRTGAWQLALQNISADVNKTRIENLNLAASATDPQAPLVLQTDKINLRRWTQILDDAGAFGDGKLQEVMLALNPKGELRKVQVSLPLNDLPSWQLRADARKVGVSAWRGVPALEKVDGFVQAGQKGGFINLDSRNGFSMHYDPTYADAMVYEQASGQVAWSLQRDKNQIYVNSGPLRFRNGDEEATGFMWLSIPWQRNSGDIDLYLQVGARNLAAELYKKYTPSVVPKSLLNWLGQSIGDHNNGVVNQAGFVYRGTLNTKNPMARSHQLYLDIEHAELNYHAGWPGVRDIKGKLLVNDNEVEAQIDDGKLFSSVLRNTLIHSSPNPDGEGALLTVKGNVKGPAGDGLRVLRESQLRKAIGSNMDQWTMDGDMQTRIDIAVPLAPGAKGARQQVDVELTDSKLDFNNLNLNLTDLSGRIGYNQQQGLRSEALTAKLFNETVEANLSNLKRGGELSQTLIDVSGKVESGMLAQWSKRPELLFLEGKIPYQTRIQLFHGGSHNSTVQNSAAQNTNTQTGIEQSSGDAQGAVGTSLNPSTDKSVARIRVTSDLDGVGINLPAPYGKTAEENRPLAVTLTLNQLTSLVDVRYGHENSAAETEAQAPALPDYSVNALLKLQRSDNTLQAANLALARPASLPDTRQFLLSGYLPEFNLTQWQSVLERYRSYTTAVIEQPKSNSVSASPIGAGDEVIQSKTLGTDSMQDKTRIAGLPLRADIVLGKHRIGPLQLEQLALTVLPKANFWEIDFYNPVVAGLVRLPHEKTKAIDIDLTYLHLPRSALGDKPATDSENQTPVTEFDPRTLPRADVSIAELYFDEKNWGNWSLEIHPDSQGAVIDNIRGNIRGITISGMDPAKNSAQPSGAQLIWRINDSGTQTRFIGLLSAENMGDVLAQWGKPDIIESHSASYQVDLTWPGAPQQFALVNLQGTVDLLMQDGRFKRNASAGSDGFLRLLALVNFDSLARRLRLDFSDLYKSGLAYDQLRGTLSFDRGKLLFSEPLLMESPSSRLQMAGSINLQDETINTRLVATLPVAGNLTFLAALATGLPAAAGVFLISKIFKKQVDQATSISYRIRGSWDEPEMKFDRLFESEDSLRDKAEESLARESIVENSATEETDKVDRNSEENKSVEENNGAEEKSHTENYRDPDEDLPAP